MVKRNWIIAAFLTTCFTASGAFCQKGGDVTNSEFTKDRLEYIESNKARGDLEDQISAVAAEHDVELAGSARDALKLDILTAEFEQISIIQTQKERVQGAVPDALEGYLEYLSQIDQDQGPETLPTFESFLAEELGRGAIAMERNKYSYLDIEVLPSHFGATTLIDGNPLKPLPPDKAREQVRRVVTTPGQHSVVVENADRRPCEREVSVTAWNLGKVSCTFPVPKP